MVRWSGLLAGALTLLVLSGCTGEPVEPAPGATTPAGTASSPEGEASTPDPTEPTPREPPPRATAPAPSTAGELGQDDLPQQVLGFTAEEREPAEGEYVPNGTWTHEVDAEQAAWEALPRCGTGSELAETPTHALAATYLDPAGRPGNGLLMAFADEAAAQGYARGYRELLLGCPRSGDEPLTVAPVAEQPAWYAGHRSYGPETWSEVVVHRDAEVLLVIVSDGGAADEDALSALATELAG